MFPRSSTWTLWSKRILQCECILANTFVHICVKWHVISMLRGSMESKERASAAVHPMTPTRKSPRIHLKITGIWCFLEAIPGHFGARGYYNVSVNWLIPLYISVWSEMLFQCLGHPWNPKRELVLLCTQWLLHGRVQGNTWILHLHLLHSTECSRYSLSHPTG